MSALTGLSRATVPSADAGPDVPVVDAHTHLFNGRDLPVYGIARAHGVPFFTAHFLNGLVRDLTASDPEDGAVSKATSFATPAPVLSESDRRKLEKFLGLPPRSGVSVRSAAEGDLELIARALLAAGIFEEPESPVALKSTVSFQGIIDTARVVFSSHEGVANLLESTFVRDIAGRTLKPDFFVHHMMDLETTYNDAPHHRFREQIARRQTLEERRPNFVGFVAFDPHRRDDAFELLEHGLATGALGAKFYPPSGYRPVANVIPPKPSCWPFWTYWTMRGQWNSRYRGRTGAELDAVTRKFFTYAVAHDLPIFTHCTPGGFEAVSGYGRSSDPRHWQQLLDQPEFHRLRLCFGHSGGYGYWMPDGTSPESEAYGRMIVDLCLAHPNVYCEVAYLERVLGADGKRAFAARLAEVINLPSKDGTYKFGDRLIYGSDWWMLEKEQGRERYLAEFHDLMSQPPLAAWHRKFFSRNAVDFLRLRERSNDPKFASRAATWRSIIAGADWSAK